MIVIGDVHGEYNSLLALLDILPQTDKICFVGDLIDRGPDPKKIIDLIRKKEWKCVLGNHEEIAINDYRLWSRNGAETTIKSFGGFDKMRDSGVFEWFSSLPLFAEWNRDDGQKFLISHSFAYNGEDTWTDEVLWGRDAVYSAMMNTEYNLYDKEKDDGKFINVFGHTPLSEKSHLKINDRHWLIDGACTYGGKLTALDLQTEKIYFVDKVVVS